MSWERTGDGYRLVRDDVANTRLNAQHYLWKAACGFNIHERARGAAGSRLTIAEIGVGTAIWMIDVKSSEDHILDGFDLSLKQAPPAALWPEGFTIRVQNILDDVPADARGKYDVVHVRLIQGGLRDDPKAALKNMMTMLKPGGYLQWEEINLPALVPVAAKPGLSQENMDEVVKEVHRLFKFGKWVPRLAEICTEVGFEESQTHKYRIPRHVAVPFCQTQLQAYEEVSKAAMDNDSADSEGPRFRKLLAKANEELNSGVWLDHVLEVTVARKS